MGDADGTRPDDPGELLHAVADRAAAYLAGLDDRPVWPSPDLAALRSALDTPLPDAPQSPHDVVDALADAAEPGVVATGSPRYFGFVIGGALPAALAADWLATAWDQNAGLYAAGPSAAVAEEVAGRWALDVLGLPATASFAFVTGCQMAHVTAFAAARHHVLRSAGWDVEADGLAGSPPIRVLAGEHSHVTVDRALRFLGIGTNAVERVAADDAGRMRVDALAEALRATGGPGGAAPRPTIVCIQAGEVNTGAIDPIGDACDVAHEAGAWAHVDGAFGLWAAASPATRPLVAGAERADSWATDFHKWLNVPYDSGFAACAHPDAHRAAMSTHAAYLDQADAGGPRDQMDWSPEFSRRARGFAVYAALRSLGRRGIADLVERCCAHARRFAEGLGSMPAAEVLNDVSLDQVLVRFRHPDGDRAGDAYTARVIAALQASGELYASGTTWRGVAAMRISIVNWRTTAADVDRSLAAIEAACADAR